MDLITRKFTYTWLKLSELMVCFIVWNYAFIFSRKRKRKRESIGAFWYYPPDLTGSNLRIGGWKVFFEKKGYNYDNFHINKLSGYVNNIEKGTWTSKYLYFSISLWRRLPQILKAHRYETIWIDRAIIPYFPRKSAFIERQIKKVCTKLVVDTTDGGDYLGNPILMEEILNTADEVTVGYKYLKKIYEDRYKVTQVFWTIPTDSYITKTNYEFQDQPKIGWMGSPSNFQYVKSIIPQLKELAKKHNFIFSYICRQNFDIELEGINTDHHYFGEDYYQIMSQFDIGISPFLVQNLATKGKIAMKHQEFLLMGTPQVCSDVAISEFVEDSKHVLLAENTEEWGGLIERLLLDNKLREKLGENSKELFNDLYTYDSQFHKLEKVLAVEN